MKLLLTSNGITSPEIENALTTFIDGRTNLRVAIIPTASDLIKWVLEKEEDTAPYDSVAKLLKETGSLENLPQYLYYKNKEYDVIFVDLKEDPTTIKEKLQNIDIIDVLGGDINWLLDWSKKSGFNKYLKDLLNDGVIYCGSSAGSALVTPDIGLDWWESKWKLDHIGLGIVDFCLAVHQKEEDLVKNEEALTIKRSRYGIDYSWNIYLLQDGQALMVNGDTVEHIGPGTRKYI